METNRPTIPRIPWRLSPLLLALYAGAIAALSWPWLATASTRVLNHWDPPFHAWKLQYAARTLLSGHILPPGGNTNLYYPNSGAFFFEALHWPQAVFAAPLLAAGANPVLTYHVTMVFFWALSSVLFWAWLRALGTRRPGAVLGGLFFTVLPYRMSYLVEFNMQLSFGLPLLLLAMTRFFQRPGFRYALLAAAAWWLQATSELYQAVFVLFALPLLALPLFARDPSLLRSGRRFWWPLVAAAALCAALSLPFLLPYASTLGDGTLSRSLNEMRSHSLEPLTYLLSWGRVRLLPELKVRREEMCVFPTIALTLAAAWGFAAHRRGTANARQRLFRRLFSGSCILLAALAVLCHALPTRNDTLNVAFSILAVVSVLLSVPVLLRRDRSVPRAVAAGLAAAALFGFVMGLGPDISILSNRGKAPNYLFRWIHAFVPGLAGFRVVSRFAVFPVLAVCAAAAAGVDAAARALRNRPPVVRIAATVLFLALFLAESLPEEKLLRTRPVRDVSVSTAIAALDARKDPFTLAIVPMGLRDLDSEHMLTIERNDRLGLWAWGGAYPVWTGKMRRALGIGRQTPPERAALLLRQPWPETLVLEDRRTFPEVPTEDYAAWFGPLAETIAEDPEFRLMRILPPAEDSTEVVRLVRLDIARSNPVARFFLSAQQSPARVWLDVNGEPVGVWDATSDPVECRVDVPAELLVDHLPERFRFHAENDSPFRVSDFRLESGSAHPGSGTIPGDRPDLPWLSTFRSLPAGAIPLNIRYPHGMVLCGAMLLHNISTANSVPIRLFLRFPPTTHVPPEIVLSPGFAVNGSILFQHPFALRSVADGQSFRTADGKILAVDLYLPVRVPMRNGEVYDLTLDVLSATHRRRNGHDAEGHKVRHVGLGLRWGGAP